MVNILSKDEVDSLLKGLSDGEVVAETDTPVRPEDVIRYDFTGYNRIIDTRMPVLEMINGRLCKDFGASLSALVRKKVEISVDSNVVVKYEDFYQSLPVPTSMHIFRMVPLKGHAILALESRLVFNLIECYFGGKASKDVKIEGRDYTAIENRMIQNVLKIYLEDLAQAWKPVYEISTSYLRSEMNLQFTNIALPNDLVGVTIFRVGLDGVSGIMKLCIPCSTIEPIRNKLRAVSPVDELEIDIGWKERVQERIKDLIVELRAELGTGRITGHRLLGLTAGDVIQLQQNVNEPLVAKVANVPKFKGRAGVVKGNKAIKIEKRC